MRIEIREVILDDAKLLFDWANDPGTRQNSFQADPIDWNEHIHWLSRKIIDPNTKIFIIHSNEKPIGVVRFEISEMTIVGITVNPELRGKGLGSQILNVACQKYWESNSNNILAYIKKSNSASQHIFEKVGFNYIREDKVNSHQCLIYQASKNAH